MNLESDETKSYITALIDYTKEHLYEIDTRIKLIKYSPVYFDVLYSRLFIRLRFVICDNYTVERVITIDYGEIDHWLVATDNSYLARYVGEKMRVEINYCRSLADMFDHHSDEKVQLKRKYQQSQRSTRVLSRRFKPRTGKQQIKRRDN
ncbi:hypothetical protein EfsSzw1_39 [Enterococcus phage EfsSzw-1]|uniref:Uncharacterized protein n=1 Tax=Enterococcus phage EfsSzw-1 TaxID=2419745 RepID=A0A411B7D3_9CAUD|nr:hypothetical protein EfsSzw1_39 [Enterococcus phage EfsSzw-1]